MAKSIFIPKEWLLASKQWSDRWKDPNTGIRGCGFYIVDQGLSTSTKTPDGNWLVTIKNVPEEQRPDTIMVQLTGGKAIFEQAPKEVYINVEDGKIMLPVDHKKQLAKTPTLPTEIAEQPNA